MSPSLSGVDPLLMKTFQICFEAGCSTDLVTNWIMLNSHEEEEIVLMDHSFAMCLQSCVCGHLKVKPNLFGGECREPRPILPPLLVSSRVLFNPLPLLLLLKTSHRGPIIRLILLRPFLISDVFLLLLLDGKKNL